MSRVEALKTKTKLLLKAKKKAGIPYALKDALNQVARVTGYASWRELRKALPDNEFYWRGSGSAPNHWCKTHEEAQKVLETNGGYLIPYRHQYFVCQADYVEGLGIKLDDVDLLAVGPDWAAPQDPEALARLNEKIKKLGMEAP